VASKQKIDLDTRQNLGFGLVLPKTYGFGFQTDPGLVTGRD